MMMLLVAHVYEKSNWSLGQNLASDQPQDQPHDDYIFVALVALFVWTFVLSCWTVWKLKRAGQVHQELNDRFNVVKAKKLMLEKMETKEGDSSEGKQGTLRAKTNPITSVAQSAAKATTSTASSERRLRRQAKRAAKMRAAEAEATEMMQLAAQQHGEAPTRQSTRQYEQ